MISTFLKKRNVVHVVSVECLFTLLTEGRIAPLAFRNEIFSDWVWKLFCDGSYSNILRQHVKGEGVYELLISYKGKGGGLHKSDASILVSISFKVLLFFKKTSHFFFFLAFPGQKKMSFSVLNCCYYFQKFIFLVF